MAEYVETITTKIICPDCDSPDVVKHGFQNDQQRYRCKPCGNRFRYNGNAEGSRFTPEQKGFAVRLFYSGMSYKQIAEAFEQHYDIPEPSKRSIYEWVREYTDRALEEGQKEQHKAQTGDTWVADELQVKVGGQKAWLWNVMDVDTRYIVGSYLTPGRTGKDALEVMERAEAAAQKHPKTIKTDRLASYDEAIATVYPYTKHVKSDGIRAEINNNMSERLQGSYRSRVKTLRGLDSIESGDRYVQGWTFQYNHFRDHEGADGEPPAVKAEVKLPYDEWADVVRGYDGPPAQLHEERKVAALEPPAFRIVPREGMEPVAPRRRPKPRVPRGRTSNKKGQGENLVVTGTANVGRKGS